MGLFPSTVLGLGWYLRQTGFARGYRQGVKDTEKRLSKEG